MRTHANKKRPIRIDEPIIGSKDVNHEVLLSGTGITPGQQLFINALNEVVNGNLSSQLDGKFEVVSYPAGFNYGVTLTNNGYYNPATLQDIDTLLGISSNGMLELTASGFSGTYATLLQDVTFYFSQADQQTINSANITASEEIALVLAEFTDAGGIFSNPLPFGGELQDVFNQLTALFKSLENLPDSLIGLSNAIAFYKNVAASSYALRNKLIAATSYLASALANLTAPSAVNGGMQTGASSFYPGFTPDRYPTTNQLLGGLNSPNSIEVDIALSNFNAPQSNISVNGSGGLDMLISDILTLSINGSAAYDLSKYTSSASTINMKVIYQGVTVFSAFPSILSIDGTQGWYANDILQEVVDITGHDATGYALVGGEYNVGDYFGEGKIFSRLKTFVISQQPTIQMTFTGANASQIIADFQVNASADISLLGLFSVGSANMSYYVKIIDDKSVSGSVIVTFGPSDPSGTIPIAQQKAFVLGGVASYPPNNM